jgi:predicted DNA-binding transcriptional regulator AlpA
MSAAAALSQPETAAEQSARIKRLLTMRDVAERLQISSVTAWRLYANANSLPRMPRMRATRSGFRLGLFDDLCQGRDPRRASVPTNGQGQVKAACAATQEPFDELAAAERRWKRRRKLYRSLTRD